MKLRRLYLFVLIFCTVGAMSVMTSCSSKSNPQKVIERSVENLQSTLPIPEGDNMTLTKVTYENNVLTYVMELDDIALSAIKTQQEAGTVKQSMLGGFSMQWKQRSDFFNAIIGAQATIVMELCDKHHHPVVELRASSQELNSIYAKARQGNASKLLDMIKNEIAGMKPKFPMTVSKGLKVVDANVEGTKVNYIYRVDADIDSVPTPNVDKSRQETIKTLQGAYTKILPQIFKEHIIFCYIYQNRSGKELYRIEVNANDLRKKGA